MITQDLGIATAYGYAKSKGYTGTEAEFAELMASYASTAQTAIEAADRAVEANTAAHSAKSSAQSSASTASTAAQTATSKASEAVTAAGTATTKASEASQSATSASQSAESAGTSAQTATTAATTATTKASEASESATTATAAKTDAETARDAAVQSASEAAASAASIDPATLEHRAYGAYVVESATGAVASFPDGADSIPMKDVLVHIEPVQEGSGDPSPDNVRPITGWTGCEVQRTGKNLVDVDRYGSLLPMTSYGITWSKVSDGVYHVSGTATNDSYFNLTFKNALSSAMPCKSLIGQRLTIHTTVAEVKPTLGYFRKDDTFSILQNGDVLPDNAVALRAYVRIIQNTVIDTDFSVQIELGSTTTDYEPYSGQTYDITFPTEAGTVYGGTLDVTSGVLTVDRAIDIVDTARIWDNGILDYGAVQIRYSPLNQKKYATQVEPNKGLISNLFRSTSSGGECTVNGRAVNSYIYFNMPRAMMNEALARQWFTDNPTQIGYELAEPITYHLTPQEITSLLGTNNVWADTGDSEVEYRADTKLYITKKITEAVSALS